MVGMVLDRGWRREERRRARRRGVVLAACCPGYAEIGEVRKLSVLAFWGWFDGRIAFHIQANV